jgi:hypothetical protein
MVGEAILGILLDFAKSTLFGAAKENLLIPLLENREKREAFERALGVATEKFREIYCELYSSLFDEHFIKECAACELVKFLQGKIPNVATIATAYQKYFHRQPGVDIKGPVEDLVGMVLQAMKNEPALHAWVSLYQEDKILAEIEKRPTTKWMKDALSVLREEVLEGRQWEADGLQAEGIQSILDRYCAWQTETTNYFSILGIAKPLPISRCWIELETVELPSQVDILPDPQKALDRYHDSYRHGKAGRERVYDAEWLGASLRRVVVVGGPGSGKSLLLKRIANRESALGQVVLLVRLRYIAERMFQGGERFEDALLSQSTDGTGLEISTRSALAEKVDFLLADGLDECGNNRQAIAESIFKWAGGHKETGVIVTTRSVGHNPALLPGWRHFELLPPDLTAINRFVEEGVLAELCQGSSLEFQEIHSRLKKVLKDNFLSEDGKQYEFIRRIPLVLSLMVGLAVNGAQIPENKVELYKGILHLLATTEVSDRNTRTDIDEAIAFRSIEVFGWLLMMDPIRQFSNLIQEAGKILSHETGEKPLVAERLSEKAFHFWEERRVLEKLNSGFRDFATFVHLGFCEYAAARHVKGASLDEFKKWVLSTHEDPRWREIFLYLGHTGMAEEAIRILLELDSPEGLEAENANLAAEMYASTDQVSEETTRYLLKHLLWRIESDICAIICRAACSALAIARRVPKLVGPAAQGLFSGRNEWTRLSALALCLEAGETYVDIDDLRRGYTGILKTTMPSSGTGGLKLTLRHDLVELRAIAFLKATELLLDRAYDESLVRDIQDILKGGEYSLNIEGKLRVLLRNSGKQGALTVLREHDAQWLEKFGKMNIDTNSMRYLPFLFLVSIACERTLAGSVNGHRSQNSAENGTELAKLIEALRIWEMPANDLILWGATTMREEAILSIKGAIVAASIDPKRLKKDIAVMKSMCEEKQISIFASLPRIPVEVDWRKVVVDDCQEAKMLARALNHPCQSVAYAAANMILSDVGREASREAAKGVLTRGGPIAMYLLSQMAADLWGDEASEIILKRLEGTLTEGCEHLLKALPRLVGSKTIPRVIDILRKSIYSELVQVAVDAAKACVEVDVPEDLLNDVHRALAYWKEHETPYPVGGGIIPPSPREAFVICLCRYKKLSSDELLELCSDARSDVRKAAEDGLYDVLKGESELISAILTQIRDGKLKGDLLRRVVLIPPDILRPLKDELIALLESPDPSLRRIMFWMLPKFDWIPIDETISLGETGLRDSEAKVRDAAGEAMIRLRRKRSLDRKGESKWDRV